MLKSFFTIFAAIILLSGCISSKLETVANKSGYHVSSEALTFDITDESVLDMKNWLATDKTPYTATIKYGKLSNKMLRSVFKVLNAHKIKYKLEKGASENKIILSAVSVKALECEGMGCASSNNLLKMLSDEKQLTSPKASKNHYSYTFN